MNGGGLCRRVSNAKRLFLRLVSSRKNSSPPFGHFLLEKNGRRRWVPPSDGQRVFPRNEGFQPSLIIIKSRWQKASVHSLRLVDAINTFFCPREMIPLHRMSLLQLSNRYLFLTTTRLPNCRKLFIPAALRDSRRFEIGPVDFSGSVKLRISWRGIECAFCGCDKYPILPPIGDVISGPLMCENTRDGFIVGGEKWE